MGTLKFFQKLKLPTDFPDENPENCPAREDWASRWTNDNANRGVTLIQEYKHLITQDEEQLQYLLQVVVDHCRAYPDSRKVTLTRGNNEWSDATMIITCSYDFTVVQFIFILKLMLTKEICNSYR